MSQRPADSIQQEAEKIEKIMQIVLADFQMKAVSIDKMEAIGDPREYFTGVSKKLFTVYNTVASTDNPCKQDTKVIRELHILALIFQGQGVVAEYPGVDARAYFSSYGEKLSKLATAIQARYKSCIFNAYKNDNTTNE